MAGLSSSGLVEAALRHARPPNPRRRRRALELKSAAVDVSTPRIPPARDEADRPNGGSTGRPSGVAAAPRRPTALGRRRCPSVPLRSGGEVGRHVSVSAPAVRTSSVGSWPNHHQSKPAGKRLGKRRGWAIAEARGHRTGAALAFCTSGTQGTTGRSRGQCRTWCQRALEVAPGAQRRRDVAHAPQMSLSRRTRRCGRVLGLVHGVELGDCGDREGRGAQGRQPRSGISARPSGMPIGDRWSNASRRAVSKPRDRIRPARAKRGPSRFDRVGIGAAAAARATPPAEFFRRA